MSRERVSGFPEKGADLGEVWELPGKFGELPGKSGKLSGNLWIAVKFHSERTSGEVAEKLPGTSGEVRGSSGEPTPSQRLAKFVSNRRQKHNLSQNDPLRVHPKSVH